MIRKLNNCYFCRRFGNEWISCKMYQMNSLQIVADDKIPFLKGLLEYFAEIKYISGSAICNKDVQQAEAIITRTRTQCNAALLENTNVKFIGSATIGLDHIDLEYCSHKGIQVINAPGCNSGSVMQYVTAALLEICKKEQKPFSDYTIGIVGVGNVGRKVAAVCQALGFKVLLNDPPRERAEKGAFLRLDDLLKNADIITMHVPLIRQGRDKTFHLVDDDFLGKMKSGSYLINSSRGSVADTKALLWHKNRLQYIIDVWEQEPEINLELLHTAMIATPHIAGYSIDGKANGTKAVVRALSKQFGLPMTDWSPEMEEPLQKEIPITDETLLVSAVRQSYDIMHDDKMLRENPAHFELLRGNYHKRWEFHHYSAQGDKLLKSIGFK